MWGKLLPETATLDVCELRQSLYSIGRHKKCDIILSIPTISNVHCKLVRVRRVPSVLVCGY